MYSLPKAEARLEKYGKKWIIVFADGSVQGVRFALGAWASRIDYLFHHHQLRLFFPLPLVKRLHSLQNLFFLDSGFKSVHCEAGGCMLGG